MPWASTRRGRLPEDRPRYPVRVDGVLDAPLSRGLWLVTWLLPVPHHVVLALPWAAVAAVTVVAFVAVLVTGRYPAAAVRRHGRVLRRSWQVQHDGHAALGTDRCPPFTPAGVPGSPARLDVPHRAGERARRGGRRRADHDEGRR